MSSLIKVNYPLYDDPAVAHIQFNRPEVFNALSTELLTELIDEVLKLQDKPEVKVFIISGDDKAFAAGADLKQLSTANPIDQLQDKRLQIWKQFQDIHKPLIAAVNGLCLGAGNELAMMCDIMIAGDNAQFGQPEVKVGTIPGAGGTQRLTRIIGKSKAMEMVLTGKFINAQQALSWGLVSAVVPYQTLIRETYDLATQIAQHSTVATRLAKEAVNKAYETHLSEGLAFERRNFNLTFASEDQKEGMKAFLEKRKPQYKGK